MSWNFDPEKRLWPRVNKGTPGECWEWNGAKTEAGYGLLTIQYKNYYAHRLAWKLHNGHEIPEDGVICHKCDNPACCNPAHLFLGTQADNLEDASIKGRLQSGENHALAVLTNDEVRQIRGYGVGSNLTQQQIANRFNVSRLTINDILTGKTWRHFDPEWKPLESKSRGITHPNAKLTEDNVRQIRKLSKEGKSQRAIAKTFGVSRGTIEPIIKGETWKHVN